MLIIATAALFAAFAGAPAPDDVALSTTEIVQRLMDANHARFAALHSYTGMRKYRLVNHRFNKTGEITVRMTYTWPNRKSFEVVSESGSAIVRNRVLRKMVDAEAEAAAQNDKIAISLDNYNFKLEGQEACDARRCYLLDAEPKTANKFLFRGRIWVDADDFAVVRVEGAPAKNPSFWTRHTRIVQQNRKFGSFWLPVSNQSQSDAFIFGPTELTIDYLDYQIPDIQLSAGTAPPDPKSKAAPRAATLPDTP